MLQTLSVKPKEVVAVSWDPTEIYLRKSGNEYKGKEEMLCKIPKGTSKLLVSKRVAEKYGIEICFIE